MHPAPKIVVKDNPADVARTGAMIFQAAAKTAIRQRGAFMVALSGGDSPRGMHRTLAQKPFSSEVPWNKTDIFWVDERCVSESDPDSNYGAAREAFLGHLPLPPEQIHAMPGEVPPEKGARKYEEALIRVFGLKEGRFPIFDMIFLGMGKDGHTASLFPGQKALDEKQRLVVAVQGGDPHINRLTMTLPLINRARQIVFLVSGIEKAETLRSVFEERAVGLPVQRIRPLEGNVIWLLDCEAASLLT
ncbi:MAG: 6-phosphogluconolactonase [Deltaproteobacteria bacterium]|nr:6-phosphogluconolactonase [Deltaproteobacteria bacterium]